MRASLITAAATAAALALPGVAADAFCAASGEDTLLYMFCSSGVINNISFASYGTSSGECPSYAPSTCNANSSLQIVSNECLGKSWCAVPVSASAFGGDPCPNVVKHLQVVAQCSGGPGYGGSPTCSLNGTACPPPTWTPTWNLTMSTVCQPSNNSYFVPPADQPWGLVSLDWSVANDIWRKPNQNDSTVEATSIHGCQLIKQVSPNTICFIYHNMELALQALESQREVMYTPQYADWFLQYTDGQGNKNGTIYNEPGGPGDQFFWDFRVPAAAEYYVSSVLATLVDPAVDGTFTDDVTGLPAEHDHAPANMNLSAQEVADVQYATQAANAQLIDRAVAASKFVWQAFGAQDGVGQAPPQGANCVPWMQRYCDPSYQLRPMTMLFDPANAEQITAGFLVVRPPYAYLGFGWESDMRDWHPIFLTQVGEPLGLCAEITPGVFTRAWSTGNATLDCNTWTGTVPHA